jgi:hypothetical protein
MTLSKRSRARGRSWNAHPTYTESPLGMAQA